ncbi:hypothetical protein B0H14DRAFT_2610888 [Mycena olivaceomarginata]|nr:hypothetical protein B0H14DRAFT_2610888 [Mycena olivaceomarginata]
MNDSKNAFFSKPPARQWKHEVDDAEDDSPSDKDKPKTVNTTHNCFFSDAQTEPEARPTKSQGQGGNLPELKSRKSRASGGKAEKKEKAASKWEWDSSSPTPVLGKWDSLPTLQRFIKDDLPGVNKILGSSWSHNNAPAERAPSSAIFSLREDIRETEWLNLEVGEYLSEWKYFPTESLDSLTNRVQGKMKFAITQAGNETRLSGIPTRPVSEWFDLLQRFVAVLQTSSSHTTIIRPRRRHPTNLSTAQPRVGAHEAARAPLSLEKHEMPRTEKNLPGCETVGTTRHYSQVTLIRVAPARKPARTTPARTTAPDPTSNNDRRLGVAVAPGAHSAGCKVNEKGGAPRRMAVYIKPEVNYDHSRLTSQSKSSGCSMPWEGGGGNKYTAGDSQPTGAQCSDLCCTGQKCNMKNDNPPHFREDKTANPDRLHLGLATADLLVIQNELQALRAVGQITSIRILL